MRFMMLVIPKGYGKAGPGIHPDREKVERMMNYNESLRKAGALIEMNGLHPPSMGACVTFFDGRVRGIDGPFVGSQEVVGGYWMIRVKSLEKAIEWAARAPLSDKEFIEIRQVQEPSELTHQAVAS